MRMSPLPHTNVVEHAIPAADGRLLRVQEGGDHTGVPVLVHNGTPGSRLLYHRDLEDALSRGIRLLGYDRPGYGKSTPQPGRTVADAADDVVTIADALEIERLAVWGASGGGPHALACAALLPGRVTAVASLASPAPYPADGLDWLDGMGDDNIAEFGAALAGREALEPYLRNAADDLLSADADGVVEVLRSLLSPVDVSALDHDLATYFVADTRLAIGEQTDGWLGDDLAFVHPWEFELERIEVPVLLWHGVHDQFVPFAHGKWLAEHIPGVEAHLSEGDGHVSLVHRVPEVHAWLLERSRES
jgi:pimeloyl-ACP methyl ester carboxylesterase